MLRLAPLLVALSLGAAQAQEPAEAPNEARALFEAMEAKVLNARTLDVRFSMQASQKDMTMKVTGRLRFDGEQARCETTARTEGRPERVMHLVLSGNRIGMTRAQGGEEAETLPAKTVTDGTAVSMRSAMARVSVMLPQAVGDLGAETLTSFTPEGYALGAKLEQGAQTLQAITYRATVQGEVLEIELWIDLATQLPAKRRIVSQEGQVVSETFDSIELDVEFPANTFTVPGAEKPAPILDPDDIDPEPAPLPGK